MLRSQLYFLGRSASESSSSLSGYAGYGTGKSKCDCPQVPPAFEIMTDAPVISVAVALLHSLSSRIRLHLMAQRLGQS